MKTGWSSYTPHAGIKCLNGNCVKAIYFLNSTQKKRTYITTGRFDHEIGEHIWNSECT